MTGGGPRTVDTARRRIARARARTVRRLAALLLVVAGSVLFLTAAERVTVTVDGEEIAAVRSHGATVGDLLTRLDLGLAADDRIVPPRETALADGMAVEIRRARPVTVVTERGERRLRVTAATVGEVLDAAGLVRLPRGTVRPPVDAAVESGMRIEVRRPLAISVHADGRTHARWLHGGRVADALRAVGVGLGPSDLVDPPPSARLVRGLEIRVRRVDHEQQVDEVALPFDEVVVEDPDRYVDERSVVQEGVEGLRHDVYRVRIVDGDVVERTLVRQDVVTPPVDRIVEVGTRPRPVAPAAPSGSVWDRLAGCESNGNWRARGTYHGGLQFHPDTWNRWKPSGYPDYAYQATREQQIEVGRRLQAARGWSPWPHCSRVLGLR